MFKRIAASAATLFVAFAGTVAVSSPSQAAEQSCNNYSSSTSTCTNTTLNIAGTTYSVDWYQPTGASNALLLGQHGFSRDCAHLRGTSKAIAEKGVTVLCINADMTGGNPDLAVKVADALTARTSITPPRGKSLPANYIVGGHSAGGHFASAVGARLDANGYPSLKGAVLWDPVAAGGFTDNLQALSDNGARRVLSVSARPSATNSFNNSFGALNSLNSGFVGMQLVWNKYTLGIPTGGSCHTDVEGENTDFIGTAGALCSPNATQTARLRDFSATWAADMANGTTTSAYYCTDDTVISTCGAKIRDLADRSLPLAAPIR